MKLHRNKTVCEWYGLRVYPIGANQCVIHSILLVSNSVGCFSLLSFSLHFIDKIPWHRLNLYLPAYVDRS